MEVVKTLRPGDSGTKKLTERFGDRLVCVRYRKDGDKKRRYTTIELIVDEGPTDDNPSPCIELCDSGALLPA